MRDVDPYAWSWDPDALILFPAMTVGYLLALRRYPRAAWRIACFLARWCSSSAS